MNIKHIGISIFVVLLVGCNDDSKLKVELDSKIVEHSVNLYSQEDVDDFVISNNNAAQIEIAGDLTIGSKEASSESNIIDISGLSNITRIEGKLLIKNNPELISVSNFENLTHVGHLSINRNRTLTEVSFSQLNEVDTYLMIFSNESIRTINGFNNLTKIGSSLYIVSNESLEKIEGFQLLNTINGALVITDNNNLNETKSFAELSHIGLDLIIGEFCYNEECLNARLKEIDFKKLKFIGGDCIIKDHPNLETISMSSLNEISGSLLLSRHPKLESGLNFRSLTKIAGDLQIESCTSLINLDAFNYSLETIGAELTIENNHSMVSMDFQKIKSINKLSIEYNNKISSCTNFFPEDIKINTLVIASNDNLEDLCSLKYLLDATILTTSDPLIVIYGNGSHDDNDEWIQTNCYD